MALSSQDGFCSLVEFENDELGSPFSFSGKRSFYCCHICTSTWFLIFLLHFVIEGKASDKDSKSPLQTANDIVIVPTENIGAVVAESRKMEADEKADDMVIESTGNVGPVIADSRKNEAEEKANDMVIEATGNVGSIIAESRKNEGEEKTDNMVIEETGNVGGVIGDSRKNEAEEKVDDMVIELTGSVGAAALDSRKTEAEDKAERQLLSSDIVKSGAVESEKQPNNPDGKQIEAGEKSGKPQSSLGGSSTKREPISNKPVKKRITPIAIDP